MEEAAGGFAAFLAARYDEAEAMARAATDGPWKYQVFRREEGRAEWVMTGRSDPYGVMMSDVPVGWMPSTGIPDPDFIAANDPKHRLEDIALKRAILALHAVEVTREECRALAEDIAQGEPLAWWEGVYTCVICGWFDGEAGGCDTARQLGTEFDNHPAYRAEWKP